MLELKGISKKFSAFTVVKDVSFAVRPGEVLGYLGPNGAGKTTTIKMLLGLVAPDKGSAEILGIPVPRRDSRARVGFLPENPYFYDHLTPRELLEDYGRLFRLSSAECRKRADALLERLDIIALAGRAIRKLSKGQVQRVGMAQALVSEPDVLVLDEPMSGLDPIGRKEIRDVLLQLRERGTTVFLNSHLLSEVERVCDRVAILDRGKILRVGGVEELTRQGNRYRIAVEGDAAKALAALGDLPGAAGVEGGLEFEAETAAAMNVAVDRLRAAGIVLREVRPLAASLEDVFIDIVEHGREGGAS